MNMCAHNESNQEILSVYPATMSTLEYYTLRVLFPAEGHEKFAKRYYSIHPLYTQFQFRLKLVEIPGHFPQTLPLSVTYSKWRFHKLLLVNIDHIEGTCDFTVNVYFMSLARFFNETSPASSAAYIHFFYRCYMLLDTEYVSQESRMPFAVT
ncbi:hypothetical protein VTO42DRAFT_6867 [Malbranchea cinnamomea]